MLSQTVSNDDFKNKVFKQALKFSKYEIPKMSLADNTYFPIVFIREISLKIKKNNRLKNSFPRAFLLNGILDYAISIKDEKTVRDIDNKVLKLAKETLNNSNGFNYIDQVSLGMVAIKLHGETNNPVYKNLCDRILAYLMGNINETYKIVLYRENKNFHYVDVLGMICPFILMYAEAYNRPDLIEFSNQQIEFYINKGLSISHLPYHSIELSNYTPMGSSNWGRGLGWYMLALSATLKYTNPESNSRYSYFKNEMNVLVSSLKNFQQNHYWGQFLGISKKWHIDTSVSCMIIYSMLLSGYECNLNNFYKFLKPLTRKNGAIDFTSGDTEDINLYSKEYGESELTQGILLSIFDIEKKYMQ
ncbi:glycoside hydrolase family 88 protein [Gaetbulibacter sp. M235]